MDPSVWPPSPASSEGQSKINRRVEHPPQLPTKVIFVIGAPGAGKGTICKQAAEKLGYYHLSAGDYLRDLANNQSDHPNEAYAGLNPIDLDQAMKRSKLIRSEQIIEILRFKLEKEHKAGWTKVIVDGFPRGVESAAAYEKLASLTVCRCKFAARG